MFLLIVGFGGLLAWHSAPVMFRGKPSTLTAFLDGLQQQSRDLDPEGRTTVTLPTLRAGETIVLAMGPAPMPLRAADGLSRRTQATLRDDLAIGGADLTFLYLVVDGEVKASEHVSRCNLSIPANNVLVLTATSRTATLECGPTSAWAPGECRDFAGLWNERCASRLTLP